MFHIVAIGGGGGATQVLKAAQPFATHLTAVIAVTDTGRSTGLARAIGGIPAPGDLRATLAAFATDPLMASLLFDGMADALQASRGQVVYICNTTTQPGQTDGYSALNHVRRVTEALGPGVLDAALLNCGRPSPAALARYAANGVLLLQP